MRAHDAAATPPSTTRFVAYTTRFIVVRVALLQTATISTAKTTGLAETATEKTATYTSSEAASTFRAVSAERYPNYFGTTDFHKKSTNVQEKVRRTLSDS